MQPLPNTKGTWWNLSRSEIRPHPHNREFFFNFADSTCPPSTWLLAGHSVSHDIFQTVFVVFRTRKYGTLSATVLSVHLVNFCLALTIQLFIQYTYQEMFRSHSKV